MTDFVPGQTLTADDLNTAFDAKGPGTVIEVVSGAGLHAGTITSAGTLLADWNGGTVSALGTGLGLSGGTISPNWRGGTVSSIGSGLSLSAGTLTATGSGGSVTSVVSGAGLHAGTITSAGTLLADWNAGTVASLGAGISLTSGTLSATGSGGSVTSVAAGTGLSGGPITTTGTLVADWQGGTVTTLGDGLNLNSGTLVARPSYAGTLTAAGSNQAGALTLTADNNVVTTAAASTGVRLKLTPDAGFTQRVVNRGASLLSVYPASGGTIEANSANAAVSIVAGGVALFIADSTTQWYVV